jgi:hypothetical protein
LSPKNNNPSVARKINPIQVDSDLESVFTVVEVNKHKPYFDQLKQQRLNFLKAAKVH